MLPAFLVTVCESRRLPAALVLVQSFLAHHDAARATIVIADAELLPELPSGDDRVRLLRGRDVSGDTFERDAALLETEALVDALMPAALAHQPTPAL